MHDRGLALTQSSVVKEKLAAAEEKGAKSYAPTAGSPCALARLTASVAVEGGTAARAASTSEGAEESSALPSKVGASNGPMHMM